MWLLEKKPATEVVNYKGFLQALDRLCAAVKEGITKLLDENEIGKLKPYLTRNEAVEYLCISPSTFERIEAEGDIVGARMGGQQIIYRKEDLDLYALKQKMDAER